MEQLKDIKAAISPDEILLIVDAMIGQDAVNAAKTFDEAVDITGVMLTKRTATPGAARPSRSRRSPAKPIKFVGVGEKLDQIEVFHPDRMASRILGMGDVLSLIEKAQQNFDMQKAAELDRTKPAQEQIYLTISMSSWLRSKIWVLWPTSPACCPAVNAKALEPDRDKPPLPGPRRSSTP